MPAPAPPSGALPSQGGFALAVVVLLLFAIAVAGAAGYQVIRTEAFQAQRAWEANQAMAVAHGGLQWFLGSHRGWVPDSTTYSINGGTVVVRARKVVTLSADEDLYLVTSRGSYTDPRYPQVPAVRIVHQYAVYKTVPLNSLAPLVTTAPRVRIRTAAQVNATDHAGSGECPGAPAGTLAGVVARAQVQTSGGGSITGSPSGLVMGTFQNVVEAVALAWDVYSDPTFGVDFDGIGNWPNFGSLPAGSFPVVRVNGDLSASSVRSGRGVLIVTGNLSIPALSFWSWEGIVMAGSMSNVGVLNPFYLDGMLVLGQGSAMGNLDVDNGRIRYQSCAVLQAGLSLAHFSPVEKSWWEEF